MKISIPTRFLPRDHRIFVLHPGKSKRFYFDFIDQKRVFLDVPGITLPEDVDALSYDVIARLRLSIEIGLWIRGGSIPKKKPSLNYQRFIPVNKSGKRATKAPLYSHEAEGLYKLAKKGDLIIVPDSGYMADVYFGEITEPFNPNVLAVARKYGKDYRIPARKIRWLSIKQPKRQFSDRLIQLMQNRRALIQISSPVDKREVYSFVYGDYIEEELGVGKIKVTHEKVDFQAFNRATSLISYFIAMQKAIEIGEEKEFLKLNISEGIDQYYEPDYIFDTSIEIRSPGHISLLANNLAVPIFVIVMLAASACDAPASAVADVELVPHSTAKNDPCFLEVSERVRGIMKMMHVEKWQEICELRREASETIGLDQNAKASN